MWYVTFCLEITSGWLQLLKNVLCFKLPKNAFLHFTCAQVKKRPVETLCTQINSYSTGIKLKVANLHANHLRTIMYLHKSKSPHYGKVFLSSNFKINNQNFYFHFFFYIFLQLRNHFEGWNPLVCPSHGLEVMVRWQEILEKKEAENSAFTQTLTQGLSHGDEKYAPTTCFAL